MGEQGRNVEPHSKTYESLFDILRYGDEEQMAYGGTLSECISNLETELIKVKDKRLVRKINLIFYPGRIIRSILDWKIANPQTIGTMHSVLSDAVVLCAAVYESDTSALKKLRTLKQKINRLPYGQELLSKKFEQTKDMITFNAYDGQKSERSAQTIVERTGGDDILFIALGHGGIPAGMDTFLRYRDKTKSRRSAFYPVRFSTTKKKDEKPQLAAEEIQLLKKASKNLKIVLFDEDAISGNTIKKASEYLQSQVFPDKEIISVVNTTIKK